MIIILYLLTLTIYLVTLAPGVFWWDSGEAISGVYLLGISHSPGYAIYNLIGKLFTYIPVGSISFRINFLSAFFGAISIFMFYFLCLKIVKNKFISFCVSFIFSFSYTFWFYSIIAEVYSIHYCLGIILIYLLIISDEKKDIRFFYFSFFIFCFSIFLHIYFIIFLPFVFFLLIKNKLLNFKTIILFFSILFILSGINIYLPFRSARNITFDFGNPEKFLNFLSVITFRESVSHPETISSFPKFLMQTKALIYFFYRQIFVLYFIFFITGIFILFKKDKELFFILLSLFLFPMIPFFLFDLETPDLWNIDYVLIFSYITFFLYFASGVTFLFSRFKKLIIVILLLIVLHQFYYGISINNKSKDKTAYNSGKKILHLLDKNAILLTDNISLYNLFKYFQTVESKRKDIELLCTTYLSQCWYLDEMRRKLYISDVFLKLCRKDIKYNDKLDADIAEEIFLKNKKNPFYILFSKNKEQEIFYNTFSKYNIKSLTEILEFENEKIISPFVSVLMKVK